jgi:hypothetical protein
MTRLIGEIIEETPAETAAFEAARRPAPPTPLEQERTKRIEAERRAEDAAWQRALERFDIPRLVAVVEQRLAELAEQQPARAAVRALAPRLVALDQDVIDCGLGRTLRDRIADLHALVTREPTLVGNAPAARAALRAVREAEGTITARTLEGWRERLGWYTAPLAPVDVAGMTAAVEALEAAVLQLIQGTAR